MHPSGLQRRKLNVPGFANHTPRSWEITASPIDHSQSPVASCGAGTGWHPDMFGGPTESRTLTFGLGLGAGPLYINAIMGQAPSSEQREHVRKISSNILREDCIRQFEEISDDPYVANGVELLPPLSREDSWSMHYDCTNQAPYLNPHTETGGDKMITQTSLLGIPRDDGSRDLAFFLRTTGPTAPHRKPSKVDHHPRRVVSASKNALRFLKFGGLKRQVRAQDRLSLRDEGGLLSNRYFEQMVSSAGKRCLALKLPEDTLKEDRLQNSAEPSILSPDILESRVSICFQPEEVESSDVFDYWLADLDRQQLCKNQSVSHDDDDNNDPATTVKDDLDQPSRKSPTPVRSAASDPPTPVPESAVSTIGNDLGPLSENTPEASFDEGRKTYQHPRPQTPKIPLPKEEFPVKLPYSDKEVEIKHPLPRRLGSHPVLLQRGSSISSTLYGSRSVPDSPGPPPPRSPLRLRRDPRTIQSIIASSGNERKATPKMAPSIKSTSRFDFGVEPIRATVTTECTGPIKRPKSRNQGRERENRIRARKLRDRPVVTRTIDSVVHAPAQTTRQKLKKLRPQIQIPDLRSSTLRETSQASGSSATSYQKLTKSTERPVSPAPSRISESGNEKTGYTPISPTASAEARAMKDGSFMSPVTLVAEEVPLPKAKPTPKPAKLILKEGKTYAPRPRSASMSRVAIKRRSRASVRTSKDASPISMSPASRHEEGSLTPPPLPPPPLPMRTLPPTPPVSGSERTSKAKSKAIVAVDGRRDSLPPLPPPDALPSSLKARHMPHIATQQRQDFLQPSRSDSRAACRVDARLEALEKQNALLSAALMAVLKTNGALNGPVSAYSDPQSSQGPMAWESRIARRSAATSHTASSSNESALEVYMSTRRGSRH